MPLATLPLVLTVVLVELAVGGAFVLWVLDRGGQAPSGALKLIAAVNAAAGGLALLLVPALPAGELAARAGLQQDPLGAFAQGIPVLLVLLLAQLVAGFLPFRPLRAAIALASLVAGGLVLMAAAVARPAPESPYDLFALLVLPLGAIALGGVTAAMLLGHWYLVTPKLSPGPLQGAAIVVIAAIALQGAVVAVTMARGELVGAEIAHTVAIGIRIGIGLLMSLALVLGAWWTASMNTQSSTGLLYVAMGTVLAGEVSARVLFFLTGVAV